MAWVCGVFQPGLIPEWFSKSGPGVAAIVAVLLYGLNRWHARQDLRAKRRVLYAMLQRSILEAEERAKWLLSLLGPVTTPKVGKWILSPSLIRIRCMPRLFELQAQLINVATYGDYATASFIESLRAYDAAVDSFDRWITRQRQEDERVASDLHEKIADEFIDQIRQALQRVEKDAGPATKALSN